MQGFREECYVVSLVFGFIVSDERDREREHGLENLRGWVRGCRERELVMVG